MLFACHFAPHVVGLWAICSIHLDSRAALVVLFAAGLLTVVAQFATCVVAPRPAIARLELPTVSFVHVASFVPVYLVLLFVSVRGAGTIFSTPEIGLFERALALGFCGTVPAVAAAHELIHSRSVLCRLSGLALAGLAHVPYFPYTHVHLHHRQVATPVDADSARPGETIFAFFGRSLAVNLSAAVVSSITVFRMLGARRALAGAERGMGAASVILSALFTVAGYLSVAVINATEGLTVLAIQGLIGFSALTAVNYIQHYGLMRSTDCSGRTCPIAAQHSWNANDALSNCLYFDLFKHSHHHAYLSPCLRSLKFSAIVWSTGDNQELAP